jgi:HD-GYP domain-containing protein (c-di-GMP phosphodiesterase class II)
MPHYTKASWLFLVAVMAAAAVAVPLLAHSEHHFNALAAAGFGILFLLAELIPISTPHGSYSISYVVGVAALIAVGPAEAAVAALFGALDVTALKRRDRVPRVLFNGSQLSLTTALSATTYVALGGPVRSIQASDFPRALLPLGMMAFVHFAVNTGIVSVMLSLIRDVRISEIWYSNYASIIRSTFAFAVLGVLMAVLYMQLGPAATLFLLVPLLVARSAFKAATNMNDAYEATLRALVTAIEAKDAYTRGHAERVSKLTTLIARELGFTEKEVRNIRIAALMHDVGKLVVSTAILTKPGKLTDEEYEHMKWHPIFGCEVIEEIDFLRDGEAVNAVRHHHERLDGRGYPDNLFGDDVPLTARVVMVADAFDSMTSTRTYRFAKSVDDGLRELRRCAATQFDPLCIAALDRAVHKHGWEPTPELYEGEKTDRPAVSVHAQHA